MKNNLKFISSDLMARQLSLQDISGGYPDKVVSEVVLTITNPFSTKKDGFVKYTEVEATDIISSKVFTVDSHKLGVTDASESYLTFKDGVLDLNYYVGFESVTVTGTKNTNFLISTINLDTYLTNYDSVIIGGKVYELDKSKPTNAGTVIYLFEDLTEDVTNVTFAERSNLKVLNDFITKCIIAKSSGFLANTLNVNRQRFLEEERGALKVIRNKMASEIYFDQEDYIKADTLLRENLEIGRYLGVLKGNEIV